MKKTIVKISTLFLVTMLFLTGCHGKEQAEQDAQLIALQDKVKVLETANQALEEQVNELTKQIEALQNEEEKVADVQELVIYSANIDNYEKEKVALLEVTGEISINEKLERMANALSEQVFDGLPIVIEEIKVIDGKKIAIVDLQDARGKAWSDIYFQGSAGGMITKQSILETLLQREYEGEWIDGIALYYNGDTAEYDHISLLGEKDIYYR